MLITEGYVEGILSKQEHLEEYIMCMLDLFIFKYI